MLLVDKSTVLRVPNYIKYPDASNLTPSGDFTLEFFDVVFTSVPSQGIMWHHYNSASPLTENRSMIFDYLSGALRFVGSTAGTSATTTSITYTWTPTVGTPYQLAVDRSGSTVRVYVDGAVGATGTISGALFNTAEALYIGIGIQGTTLQNPFPGSAKAVRYTNGVARYAGAYTPPSLPLPTS